MVQKTLYRSTEDRKIAGVCGGLADYFSLDANLIRLAAVALIPAGGASLLVYIVAWAIVPEQPVVKKE
jgi:phage shock protein C